MLARESSWASATRSAPGRPPPSHSQPRPAVPDAELLRPWRSRRWSRSARGTRLRRARGCWRSRGRRRRRRRSPTGTRPRRAPASPCPARRRGIRSARRRRATRRSLAASRSWSGGWRSAGSSGRCSRRASAPRPASPRSPPASRRAAESRRGRGSGGQAADGRGACGRTGARALRAASPLRADGRGVGAVTADERRLRCGLRGAGAAAAAGGCAGWCGWLGARVGLRGAGWPRGAPGRGRAPGRRAPRCRRAVLRPGAAPSVPAAGAGRGDAREAEPPLRWRRIPVGVSCRRHGRRQWLAPGSLARVLELARGAQVS